MSREAVRRALVGEHHHLLRALPPVAQHERGGRRPPVRLVGRRAPADRRRGGEVEGEGTRVQDRLRRPVGTVRIHRVRRVARAGWCGRRSTAAIGSRSTIGYSRISSAAAMQRRHVEPAESASRGTARRSARGRPARFQSAFGPATPGARRSAMKLTGAPRRPGADRVRDELLLRVARHDHGAAVQEGRAPVPSPATGSGRSRSVRPRRAAAAGATPSGCRRRPTITLAPRRRPRPAAVSNRARRRRSTTDEPVPGAHRVGAEPLPHRGEQFASGAARGAPTAAASGSRRRRPRGSLQIGWPYRL